MTPPAPLTAPRAPVESSATNPLLGALVVAWMGFAAFAATDWLQLVGGVDVRFVLFAGIAVLTLADVVRSRQVLIGRELLVIIGLSALAVVAFVVADRHHAPGYFERSEAITLVRFLVTAALASHATVRVLTSGAAQWLWPAGLIAFAVFFFTLMIPLMIDGVNPIAQIFEAARGDADAVIVGLFYDSYVAAGVSFDGLGPAYRHETIRIIVIAWMYSLFAPRQSVRVARLRHVGTVATWGLAALALSRFTILGLLILAIVVAARAIRSGRIPRIVAVRTAIVGAIIAAVGFVAASDLIIGRLTDSDTDSAEIRADNFNQAFESIPDAWRYGLPNADLGCEKVCSPHFLPLDWWVGGGVIAGLASLAILFMLLWAMGQSVRAYWRSSPDSPLDSARLGAAALFILLVINWASTGGGLLSLGLWFAIGVAYGATHYLDNHNLREEK